MLKNTMSHLQHSLSEVTRWKKEKRRCVLQIEKDTSDSLVTESDSKVSVLPATENSAGTHAQHCIQTNLISVQECSTYLNCAQHSWRISLLSDIEGEETPGEESL